MRREHWWNWLLLIQVLLSVGLSAALWFETGSSGVLPAEELKVGPSPENYREPAGLFGPSRIVYHRGPEDHGGALPGSDAFRETWDLLMPWLRDLSIPPGKLPPANAQELAKAWTEGPAVEVIMPVALPMEDWARLWKGKPDREELPAANRFLLSAKDPGIVYISGPEGDYQAGLPAGAAERLRTFLQGLAAGALQPYRALVKEGGTLVSRPGLYVPAEPQEMARIPVRYMAEEEIASLPSRFFVDLTVVRQIGERDGAVIFTDGQKALRLYPGGFAEFTAPAGKRRSQPLSHSNAISDAASFVAGHGGWSGEPFLSSSRRDVSKNLVGFSYRHLGFPVIVLEGSLELELNDGGVLYYLNRPRIPLAYEGERRPVIAPERAIDSLEKALKVRPGQTLQVENIYQAFFLSDAWPRARELEPVWAVEVIGRQPLYVDAYTGRILP